MNRESTLKLTIPEFLSIKSISDFTGLLSENTKQRKAWESEFAILQNALTGLDGTIIFEYGIPGLQKVIDTVLLIGQKVFVIEFKVGRDNLLKMDLAQTMGYALRLKYFHSESNNHEIIPILVPTDLSIQTDLSNLSQLPAEQVYYPICCSGQDIRMVIDHFLNSPSPTNDNDDAEVWQARWDKAVYNPSPSIIEAVVSAWNNQNVPGLSDKDIDDQGKANHLNAEAALLEIISNSEKNHRKSIVFVTGAPGAGKTLVGLNTSIKAQNYGASLLSGNRPLVDVLTEALKRNLKATNKSDIKTELAVESIIRHLYTHKNEVIERMDTSTSPYSLRKDVATSAQHVIIYDEAQRAWSRDKMISHNSRSGKKTWQNQEWKFSEPEILMWDIAQLDWGVMVCLIGGGQEINRGEAGITEWLRALRDNSIFKDWDVYMAPELSSPEYNTLKVDGISIQEICKSLPHPIHFIESLHLKDCQRTTRAKGLSQFINLVVEGNATAGDYDVIKDYYRIYLTRDLGKAKDFLKQRKKDLTPRTMNDDAQAGEVRTGVLLSSKGVRMRPMGYEVKKEVDFGKKVPGWFLDTEEESIDSSDRLEVALSEFLVQGLEIDLGLVLWDADFRYDPCQHTWSFHNCKKNKWTKENNEINQFYLRNAYRVLLTRSRSEMIIFVPEGTDSDTTRLPILYDSTYEYLKSLGFDDIF